MKTTRTMAPDGLGFIEATNEPRSSVEVTRNAKGQIQWTAKLYFDGDADPLHLVAASIGALTDQLDAMYVGRLAGGD